MTDLELLAELREMIGNPSVNEVSSRQLRGYLIQAAEWLADLLKYNIVTDEMAILLVADLQEYPIPDELGYLIFAEWNDLKLTPNTTYGWEKEGSHWRAAPSSLPGEFALQGRKLILNPPPSAEAITTDSYIALRYIATTPGLGPGGPPNLAKMDQQLLVHKAAMRYCARRPGNPEHAARATYYGKECDQLAERALNRANNNIEDLQETFHVFTGRRGAAR